MISLYWPLLLVTPLIVIWNRNCAWDAQNRPEDFFVSGLIKRLLTFDKKVAVVKIIAAHGRMLLGPVSGRASELSQVLVKDVTRMHQQSPESVSTLGQNLFVYKTVNITALIKQYYDKVIKSKSKAFTNSCFSDEMVALSKIHRFWFLLQLHYSESLTGKMWIGANFRACRCAWCD